jgi:hypothetical protein
LIVNKKCCKEKLVLESRLVCKKKEKKTALTVAADAKICVKYETNTHYRRILVTPLRTNAGDI